MVTAAVKDLEQLRQWMRNHGAPPPVVSREALRSGSDALDQLLPDGGFPLGAVTVLSGLSGVGRMTLAARMAARETALGRPVAWVDGQGTLYPPALVQAGVDLSRVLLVRTADRVKAAGALEQIIAASAFRVVIASGLDEALTPARVRRLSAASEDARTCTLLVVNDGARVQAATLKLKLARRAEQIQIEVERNRRGAPGGRAMVASS